MPTLAQAAKEQFDSLHRREKTRLCQEDYSLCLTSTCNADKDNKNEPLAIVGMGMRLPGGVRTANAFWDMIIQKKDGLCEVPGTRYNIDGFYSASKPHSVKTRHGYFLQEDPTFFDADFFSISSYEAERMDPQQRMLLEVVWECLESAGETDWWGKDIGCYVGVFGEDWLESALKDSQNIDRFHAVGTGPFALANRVSYEFDFRGPSITLQTGCSSSLVGLHEACQAIQAGECSGAIVAGTSLILTPTMTTTMSDNMVLSPSGICKTFDESADGYGRGEAINAIYVKTLSQAIKDNDTIRAVIRSTSTNCDGRTPSISTPGSSSQLELIKRAYQKARIHDMSKTAFFECHGTGTSVGDTSETSVVAKLFMEKGILIGAVKPNVGHSEGASGITSIIKAALALEHQMIPPNAHLTTPNPKIPWDEGKLHVPTEPTAWPMDRAKRECGVQYNEVLKKHDEAGLLVVSAKSNEALKKRIAEITEYNNSHPSCFHDLAYTLGLRREHLSHRAFAVVNPGVPLDVSAFQSHSSKPRDMVFVFTGQGAQWQGMGSQLMEAFSSFRNDIHLMDEILHAVDGTLDWSLTDLSQPLCTAVQIGLVNLLHGWGVKASAVVGHSSGEIAAAYAAGALTLRSAILLAFYRGQVARNKDGSGAMAAVGLGREDIAPYISRVDGIAIACENSPSSTTISGHQDQVARFRELIQKEQPETFFRQLRVRIAYHSHHMLDLGNVYEDLMKPYIETNPEMVPLFSSVTGNIITNPTELGASYFRRNLESPVLFNLAIQNIFQHQPGSQTFLEVGPHSALAGPLQQIFATYKGKDHPVYIPTLVRNSESSARDQLLTMLGRVYINNTTSNLSRIVHHGRLLIDLPTYPWQHARTFRNESHIVNKWRTSQVSHHELLGSRVSGTSDLEPMWRNVFRLEDAPWVGDHVLQGDIIFPAAGYISMAGEAVMQLHDDEGYSLRNVTLKEALLLKDMEHTEMVTSLKPLRLNDLADSEWYTFTITSRSNDDWVKHCHGEVRPGFDTTLKQVEGDIPTYPRAVQTDKWYQALDHCGLSYGESFQGLGDISVDPNDFQAAATVKDDKESYTSRYPLHPTVIDNCLQLFSVAATNGVTRRLDMKAIPTAFEKLSVAVGGPAMRVMARSRTLASGILSGDATLMQGDRAVLSISKATLFSVNAFDDESAVITEVRWKPDIELFPAIDMVKKDTDNQTYVESLVLGEKAAILKILDIDSQTRAVETQIPHLKKWIDWVHSEAHKIREGQHSIVPESQQWSHMDEIKRKELFASLMDTCADKHGQTAKEIDSVLSNYEAFLSGEINPLEYMMDSERLPVIYSYSIRHVDWSPILSLLSHSNPSLKILEVGAGTGAATAYALSQLESQGIAMYSSYTFTDISPGFLSSAKEKFSGHENMEYKTLDISREPIEQGFELDSYDLVIASNVLHATPSLHATLRNVNSLLKPNGYLILHELWTDLLTVPVIMTDQSASRVYFLVGGSVRMMAE
ncbi:hypothetical protein EYZ11_009621 [Aspergillus tanneri]|uniref:Type I Polyketide synthases (Type I PKS) n=1 Tax=Aspergillus tanneri TaxID=1220188 RepID=A0A4S3JCU9_9EURO|nr:hypothetical protein EYZ11_009621 [Aspergillus tanneri]